MKKNKIKLGDIKRARIAVMKYITKPTKAAKKQMRKIRRTFKKELTKHYGKKVADQININARHIVCGEIDIKFKNPVIDGEKIARLKSASFKGMHYDPDNIYKNRLYKAGLVESHSIHPNGEHILKIKQPTPKNPHKIIQKSFFSNEWTPEEIGKASAQSIYTNNAFSKEPEEALSSIYKGTNLSTPFDFEIKKVKTCHPKLD